jgi:hypothetical protein
VNKRKGTKRMHWSSHLRLRGPRHAGTSHLTGVVNWKHPSGQSSIWTPGNKNPVRPPAKHSFALPYPQPGPRIDSRCHANPAIEALTPSPATATCRHGRTLRRERRSYSYCLPASLQLLSTRESRQGRRVYTRTPTYVYASRKTAAEQRISGRRISLCQNRVTLTPAGRLGCWGYSRIASDRPVAICLFVLTAAATSRSTSPSSLDCCSCTDLLPLHKARYAGHRGGLIGGAPITRPASVRLLFPCLATHSLPARGAPPPAPQWPASTSGLHTGSGDTTPSMHTHDMPWRCGHAAGLLLCAQHASVRFEHSGLV